MLPEGPKVRSWRAENQEEPPSAESILGEGEKVST